MSSDTSARSVLSPLSLALPETSSMHTTVGKEAPTKKHAACDECRTAKVKCSGDQAGCTRCRLHAIQCHFSDRKIMGRPRKRPRKDDFKGHGREENATGSDDTGRINSPVVPRLDNSGIQLEPFHPLPPSTSEPSTVDASSWGHAHIMTPSPNSTNDWQVVQDANASAPQESGVRQTDLPVNGESYHPAEPDPDSTGLSPSQDVDLTGVTCTCLSELYSMLISFQSLPSPSFPSSRAPLIRAINLARAVVRCPFCPRDFPSALQNLMLLTTLLPLVVHSYAQLLAEIQKQAAQGHRITYRVGDLAQAASHLHTGTADCPMGFNVELDSEEWAAMARKIVKQDIYGNAQSIDCLFSVVEELEQRQHIWHLLQSFSPHESCHNYQLGNGHGHDVVCLQLTGRIRGAIDALHL
ncbi:MAG: hypothetical protein LQ348_005655 [Seirophora lacunosa]|nr:MAG: hypothetical protein LQ348_005655 [Seirophora lacunosa]